MNIYRLFHTTQAPRIAATPNHDKFASEILGNLTNLPIEAAMPPFQLEDPALVSQGFFHLSNSVLVFTKPIYLGLMGSVLNRAGDVHPSKLNDTGEEIFLLNVLASYNCVDRSRSVFYTPTGEELATDHGMGIKKPAFFPNLIGDSWIFKIPQMQSVVFVASDGSGGADDFYSLYNESGMQELRFDLVWTE
jgi:hypothetical protein